MPLELAQDQHDTQSKKRYATPKRAAKDDPRLHAVEGALRYAYGPVLARALKDPAEGRLGISIPSYARACVRNAAMISQLCGELGEYWWRIAQYNAKSAGSSFKRMELQAREDAAVQLMELVRTLPQPWREVVQLRAIGLSWKDVSKALPHRAYFSLTDDWKRACTYLADRHGDVVARVT